MTTTINTREEWLTRCADLLIERILAPAGLDDCEETGDPLSEKLHVSCGYPTSRAFAPGARAIGQCFTSKFSTNGWTEIFISPFLDEPTKVAATLLHELIHGAKGTAALHGPAFEAACHATGLSGPATATVVAPGSPLETRLNAIVKELGDYPHSGMDLTKFPKTQGTRMMKCVCINPQCPSQDLPKGPYTLRMTWYWAREGTPFCGICDERMGVIVRRAPKGASGTPGAEDDPNAEPMAGDGDGENAQPPKEDVPMVIEPGDNPEKPKPGESNEKGEGESNGGFDEPTEDELEPAEESGDEPEEWEISGDDDTPQQGTVTGGDSDQEQHRGKPSEQGGEGGKARNSKVKRSTKAQIGKDVHPIDMICDCAACIQGRIDAGIIFS